MKERISYEVREANSSDIEDILKFTQENFPLRSNQREFLTYRFLESDSPSKLTNVIIAKDGEKIIGHRVAQKQILAFNEKLYEAYWGNDMIVDMDYRGLGVGKKIVLKMMENHENLLSVNTGSLNLAMHLKMGYHHLDSLKLFFKPMKIGVFINFVSKVLLKKEFKTDRKIVKSRFPENIDQFKLVRDITEIDNENYNWNSDCLEGIRTQQYIKWRFFYKPDVYFFYQTVDKNVQENNSYFVLRRIIWKGMNCLLMVDARYKRGTGEDKLIKKAVMKIAKDNKFEGVLWGTSIQQTQALLKKSGFIKYAEMPPISNLDLEKAPGNLILHFADSDLDFNYSNTPFVYL